MKRIYECPEIEVVKLDVENIITTSGLADNKLDDIWETDGSKFTKE